MTAGGTVLDPNSPSPRPRKTHANTQPWTPLFNVGTCGTQPHPMTRKRAPSCSSGLAILVAEAHANPSSTHSCTWRPHPESLTSSPCAPVPPRVFRPVLGPSGLGPPPPCSQTKASSGDTIGPLRSGWLWASARHWVGGAGQGGAAAEQQWRPRGPHLLRWWLSPQPLVHPLPSTPTAGPPSSFPSPFQ